MNIIKKDYKVIILDENNKEVGHVLFPLISPGIVDIKETFVDDSLRGQGAAGKMMQATYEVILNRKLKAKLTCSYAVSWFEKHPECNDIVTK